MEELELDNVIDWKDAEKNAGTIRSVEKGWQGEDSSELAECENDKLLINMLLENDDEEIHSNNKNSSSKTSHKDLLEVGQPGLDNTFSEKNGANDKIPLESDAPCKAGHLQIREWEDENINTMHPLKDLPRITNEVTIKTSPEIEHCTSSMDDLIEESESCMGTSTLNQFKDGDSNGTMETKGNISQ